MRRAVLICEQCQARKEIADDGLLGIPSGWLEVVCPANGHLEGHYCGPACLNLRTHNFLNDAPSRFKVDEMERSA